MVLSPGPLLHSEDFTLSDSFGAFAEDNSCALNSRPRITNAKNEPVRKVKKKGTILNARVLKSIATFQLRNHRLTQL
jgi:hypothetical protein